MAPCHCAQWWGTLMEGIFLVPAQPKTPNAPGAGAARARWLVPLLLFTVLALGAALAYVVVRPLDGAPSAPAVHAPVFLPLENLVVNLAENRGEHMAQVGITLEMVNERAARQLKNHLPALRNQILLLLSQRSAQDLLTRDGKERLAADVLHAAAQPLEPIGMPDAVRQVLFSSFIIQ